MDSLKSGALTVANDQLKLIKDPLINKMFLLIIILAAFLFYITNKNKNKERDSIGESVLGESLITFFFIVVFFYLLNFFEFIRHPRAWFEQMFVFGLLYFLYIFKTIWLK
jgi:Ca2+/Na+ antiporter